MTTLLDTAITHARNGYHVFPCKPKDKPPATPNGFKDATRDETTIRYWWNQDPMYNVGIPTGEINGLWVLDCDGPEGHKALRRFEGDIPKDVPVVHTPNNGSHLYFAYDEQAEQLTNSVKRVPGLDVRADGGYVVAAGSALDSGEYKYRGDHREAVEAPQSLLSALVEASKRTFKAAPVETVIPEGKRNDTLFSLARSLYYKGLDGNEVFATLETVNENRCKPPLETSELVQIVESAGRYERGELHVSKDEDTGEVGVIMSDVQAEKVEWLWQDRIPLGKLTILDGDPSLGKSVITMDLAARVSTGARFPNGVVDHVGYLDHVDHVGNLDHLDHLGGVVILSAEDGLADTIRPRLDAAGADTSRVVAISTVPDGQGNERTIAIPEDIRTIEKAIQRVGAKLVIIDPLMAFLSGKANHDQDVRKALTPLARMAERTGVAVLVVRHLNKQQGGKALYRGGSSIGIIGAARSGLVVEQHPDNPDLRVLAMNKSNLAEKAESITYSITTAHNDSAKVEWGSATELDANDILNPDTSEVGKAKEWLSTTLDAMPLPAKTVLEDAERAGISTKTLYRAKEALGIESKKDGSRGPWFWHLTQDGQDGQGSQDGQHSQGSQGSQTPLTVVK